MIQDVYIVSIQVVSQAHNSTLHSITHNTGLILGKVGGREDHKTVLELHRDPTTKLKYQIWEIEKACRGMTSTSFDTRCGFTTARVAFNAIYSSEGDCHLLDDLTRMSAERYMSDDNSNFRRSEFALVSMNLITSAWVLIS